MAEFSPMMQRYLETKEQYKDCILFYRLGDFYEMFFEDAIIAARELEITLTGKDCGQAERAPMAGVPHHAAEMYISRLIAKGYKVAICEQLEDPKTTKGIVKRGVIRVVTPGTIVDSNMLEERKNNYIMSIYKTGIYFGISVCDITTGEFYAAEIKDNNNFPQLLDEIARYSPSELVINSMMADCTEEMGKIKERFSSYITKFQDKFFENKADVIKLRFNLLDTNQKEIENIEEKTLAIPAINALIEYIEQTQMTNLDHINKITIYQILDTNQKEIENIEEKTLAIPAINALIEYIEQTQMTNLDHINKITIYQISKYMSLDINARRNLEITEKMRDKSKKGTLLWVLDKTSTSMGGRHLRRWLNDPLIDTTEINRRLNSVKELKEDIMLRGEVIENLKKVYDIERLAGKNARRNLEITEKMRDKSKKGTLLWVLDKTSTSMGGRHLRRWLNDPLIDTTEINRRLNSVKELKEDIMLRGEVIENLKKVYDIERLAGKMAYGNANARDMITLKNSLSKLPEVKKVLSSCKSEMLKDLFENLDELQDIYELIEKSIVDDPPMSIKDGGIIKLGFDEEIDKLKTATTEGKNWIIQLEADEKEKTGIKNLKVGFNKVFGYFIEVTKSNLNQVPERYIRKQTLTNAERYITEELKNLENQILGAEEKVENKH